MRKFVAFFVIFTVLLAVLPAAAQEDDFIDSVREDDRFSWDSLDQFADLDLSGTEVTIFGAFVGPDKEKFDNVMVPFIEATGIDVVYEGSGDFETLILVRTEGGDPPDIAMFPQPGLMAEFARNGDLLPLSDDMKDYILENYAAGQSWVDLGSVDDELYVLYYNVNLKSIVWYVPANFEAGGYEIPATWDEMLALSDQIVEDGGTPWCIAIESSGATGWPATDWIEDIMLRTTTPENYDAWITNELKFTDDIVRNAFEIFGNIALNEDYVYGGTNGILTTPFGDGPLPLFTDPPGCYMHRQASFISAYFPEDVVVGEDAAFFYLPPIDEELGNPVLGAGNLTTVMVDRPEVWAVLDYLASPLAHELWAAQGDFLTPLSTANVEVYATDTLRAQGEILVNADVFRFDGSDMMHPDVGNGAFWTGVTDYISGKPLDDVLEFIQETFDDIE